MRWYRYLTLVAALLSVRSDGAFVPPSTLDIGAIGDCNLGTSYAYLVAFDDLNADPTILPNTQLIMHYEEGGTGNSANPSATTVRSYRLCQEKRVVAILGTRYSDDSKQMAYVSQAFSVPQISFGSSSSDFSVKSAFPWFSRVYPDVGKEILQMAGVLVHERWMKVAIIYTADATGNAMFTIFNKVAKQRGIRILTSTVINDAAATVDDLAVQMDAIVNSGARIILDLTNYQSIKVPLLQASVKAGLREPGYQWIGNHAATNLQEMRYANGTAIPGMEEAALGALILMPPSVANRPQFKALKQKILDLPITPNTTAMQDCPYDKDTPLRAANQGFQAQVYDAVKLLALALHEMIEVRQLDPTLITNRALLNTLIRQQRFSGASGEIALDSVGDVLIPVAAFQVPRGDSPKIASDERGYFTYDANTTYWDLELVSPFEWKGGVRPLDTSRREIYQNSRTVRDAMIAVTVICLAILLSVHGLLAWLRGSPVVKATSYLFTQLSLVGLTLITLSVLVRMFIHPVSRVIQTRNNEPDEVSDNGQLMNEDLTWQTKAKQLAVLEMWMINIGYYILVGSLFLKTSRISRIFNMTKIGVVKGTNDVHLLIALAGLILIEAGVMIGITIGDPFVFTLNSYSRTTDIWSLSREHGETKIAFPIIYIFRFIILLPTCVYTFRVRNLPAAFNEAVQITSAVYNLAFTSVLLPILESIMNPSTDSGLIAHGVVVWFITMSTAGILILPKLMTLYQLAHNPTPAPQSNYRMTLEKTRDQSITPETQQKAKAAGPTPQGQKRTATATANSKLNPNYSTVRVGTPDLTGRPRAYSGSVAGAGLHPMPQFGLCRPFTAATPGTPVVLELAASTPATPQPGGHTIVPHESNTRIRSMSLSTGIGPGGARETDRHGATNGEGQTSNVVTPDHIVMSWSRSMDSGSATATSDHGSCIHEVSTPPTATPIVPSASDPTVVHRLPQSSSSVMIPMEGDRSTQDPSVPTRIRLHLGNVTHPEIVEAALTITPQLTQESRRGTNATEENTTDASDGVTHTGQ